MAPPEYVIIRKLEFHREGGSEKHLRDIRTMLDVSADAIDRPALDRTIGEAIGAALEEGRDLSYVTRALP